MLRATSQSNKCINREEWRSEERRKTKKTTISPLWAAGADWGRGLERDEVAPQLGDWRKRALSTPTYISSFTSLFAYLCWTLGITPGCVSGLIIDIVHHLLTRQQLLSSYFLLLLLGWFPGGARNGSPTRFTPLTFLFSMFFTTALFPAVFLHQPNRKKNGQRLGGRSSRLTDLFIEFTRRSEDDARDLPHFSPLHNS